MLPVLPPASLATPASAPASALASAAGRPARAPAPMLPPLLTPLPPPFPVPRPRLRRGRTVARCGSTPVASLIAAPAAPAPAPVAAPAPAPAVSTPVSFARTPLRILPFPSRLAFLIPPLLLREFHLVLEHDRPLAPREIHAGVAAQVSVGGQLRAEHVHRGIRHVLLGVVDEREPLADANRGRAVLPERLVETFLLHEGGQTAWMDEGRGVSGGKNLSIRSVRDLRSGHRGGRGAGFGGIRGFGRTYVYGHGVRSSLPPRIARCGCRVFSASTPACAQLCTGAVSQPVEIGRRFEISRLPSVQLFADRPTASTLTRATRLIVRVNR